MAKCSKCKSDYRDILYCTINEIGEHHSYNDKPAMEFRWGAKVWWLNGEMHRENGPSIEHSNGNKEWCLNGESAIIIYDQKIIVGKKIEINDDIGVVLRHIVGCFYEVLLGNKKVLIAKV